jgi:sortase A
MAQGSRSSRSRSSQVARPSAQAPTVQLLAVLIAGLLVAGIGGVALRTPPQAGAATKDNPIAAPASSTTTTAAAAPMDTPTSAQPVDVPDDPYAAEPIRQIGTIDIPAIGLHATVYHGITLRNIDQGPSHWPGTAMPGENGNTVFAGHRVTHTHPFRDIDRLVPGDQVIFNVGGVRSVYVVTGHEVVTPKAVHIADPTPTPTGTLFACHPPHSAKFRYVVHLALLASP